MISGLAFVTDTPRPSDTARPSDTPRPSDTTQFTLTPSLTSSLTPSLTASAPRVSVSVETNCRSGPGTAYDKLGVLRVGESAEVVAQDAYGGNWIIKLPSNPAIVCWIWKQYATTTGDTASLPALTPPPTPTLAATFSLSYDGFTTCGGMYGIKFKITNTGSVTWESNQVNVTDRTLSVTKTINRDFFANYNGCALQANDSNLDPGEVGSTTSNGFAVNPTGHDFSATIQVCSQNGQGGTCINKTITFIP